MVDVGTFSRLWSLTVAAACLAGLAGCEKGPAIAHVKGKVLYKDGSVPKGGVRLVRFEPTGDSTAANRKGAAGSIQDDGSFEMFTRRPGDGVYLGEYAVTFLVLKNPRDDKALILDKYMYSAKTPYKVIVDRDIDDLSFEIEPIQAARN